MEGEESTVKAHVVLMQNSSWTAESCKNMCCCDRRKAGSKYVIGSVVNLVGICVMV